MLRVLLLLLLLLLLRHDSPPTTSRWGHLMPVFLTALKQLGHMPPATCHLLTTTYHLPPVTCQLPEYLPHNFSFRIFFLGEFFFRQRFFLLENTKCVPKGPTCAAKGCSSSQELKKSCKKFSLYIVV